MNDAEIRQKQSHRNYEEGLAKESAVATGKVTDIDVTWVRENPTATSSGLRMTTIRVCHVSTLNGALIITDQNGVDHKFPMARRDRS